MTFGVYSVVDFLVPFLLTLLFVFFDFFDAFFEEVIELDCWEMVFTDIYCDSLATIELFLDGLCDDVFLSKM